MRRTALAVLAGFWPLLLVACGDPSAPPTGSSPDARALGRAATSESAGATEATSSTLPLHFIRSNDCTGEQVELSGYIHLVSQLQPDGSVIGHFNYQQVTGVGLTSGIIYHASTVDQLRLAAPFPSSINSVRAFQLIGSGPNDNVLVRALFHITVNANGEITASIDELTTHCGSTTVT
jgi:hypothetical protein